MGGLLLHPQMMLPVLVGTCPMDGGAVGWGHSGTPCERLLSSLLWDTFTNRGNCGMRVGGLSAATLQNPNVTSAYSNHTFMWNVFCTNTLGMRSKMEK